jgi:hypothetical protein
MARLIRTRIRRLETAVGSGCPTCRGWSPTVVIDDDGVMLRPEWCPDCGRQVPVARWVHLMGVSLHAI